MFLCERVPNPVNLISQYTHHIKTARHVLVVMSAVQIELRRIAYPLLLTMANRLRRHTIACCFPVFYLDKYQILSVHSDQVDLTLAESLPPALLSGFRSPVYFLCIPFTPVPSDHTVFPETCSVRFLHPSCFYTKFLMKLLLWIGVGPYSFSAAMCAAVPYPLCLAKPYSGNKVSYSTIM